MPNADLEPWKKGANSFQKSKTKKQFGLSVEELQEIPQLIDILGDVVGKRTVDLGCGDGNLTTRLAQLGAKPVGVDGAPSQVEIARSKYTNLDFVVAGLSQKLPFPDMEVDKAVSRFLLMYISDLDTFSGEVARILKPKGKFALTITHPLYPYIQVLTHTEHRYKGLNAYSERTKGLMRFGDTDYPFYFRPTEDYINPFIKAGFSLENYKEIVPKEEVIKSNPSLARMEGKPAFLILGYSLNKES